MDFYFYFVSVSFCLWWLQVCSCLVGRENRYRAIAILIFKILNYYFCGKFYPSPRQVYSTSGPLKDHSGSSSGQPQDHFETLQHHSKATSGSTLISLKVSRILSRILHFKFSLTCVSPFAVL